MAHADYDCCAICDDKMSYGGEEASAKELICDNCITGMFAQGINVKSEKELLAWAEEVHIRYAVQVLREVGFRRCVYWAYIDALLERRGAEFDEDRALLEFKGVFGAEEAHHALTGE